MKKFLPTFFALATSSALFAEGEGANTAQRGQSLWQTLFMIGIALVFFYLILWRPEQKRRKRMKQQRESLKQGDRVTAMGIIGTVSKIQDNTVILRMVDGAKIEVLKGAITDVQPGGESVKEETPAPEQNR